MNELKKCPFCASENLRLEKWSVGGETRHAHGEYAIVCGNCGAFGPNDLGESGAVHQWNLRRPNQQGLQYGATSNCVDCGKRIVFCGDNVWLHCQPQYHGHARPNGAIINPDTGV